MTDTDPVSEVQFKNQGNGRRRLSPCWLRRLLLVRHSYGLWQLCLTFSLHIQMVHI